MPGRSASGLQTYLTQSTDRDMIATSSRNEIEFYSRFPANTKAYLLFKLYSFKLFNVHNRQVPKRTYTGNLLRLVQYSARNL